MFLKEFWILIMNKFKKDRGMVPSFAIYPPPIDQSNYIQQQQYQLQQKRPIDDLLNYYLSKEGIDKRLSNIIKQELHDATDMSNEQLEEAANELIKSAKSSSAVNNDNNNSGTKIEFMDKQAKKNYIQIDPDLNSSSGSSLNRNKNNNKMHNV
jgi:hypothetical protein